VDAGLPEAERVERALLAELDRKATLVRGPAPDDERAVRAALTLLAAHRPVLLVVRLGGAQAAQAGMDRYREVLRANDAGIAALRAAVQAEPGLDASTTFGVVSETGRNATPNERGGLDADDESRERVEVALVAEGPGVKKGARAKGDRRLEDVVPTLARLLGLPAPLAEGKPLEGILE
jgi:hypothetical protein